MYLKIIEETSVPFEEDPSTSSDEENDDGELLICGKKDKSKILPIGEFLGKEYKKSEIEKDVTKIRPIRRDANSNIFKEKPLDKEEYITIAIRCHKAMDTTAIKLGHGQLQSPKCQLFVEINNLINKAK